MSNVSFSGVASPNAGFSPARSVSREASPSTPSYLPNSPSHAASSPSYTPSYLPTLPSYSRASSPSWSEVESLQNARFESPSYSEVAASPQYLHFSPSYSPASPASPTSYPSSPTYSTCRTPTYDGTGPKGSRENPIVID